MWCVILFCNHSFHITLAGDLCASCLGGAIAGMASRNGRAGGLMTGGSGPRGRPRQAGLPKHGASKALSKVLGRAAVVGAPDPAAKGISRAKVVALPDLGLGTGLVAPKQLSQKGGQMNLMINMYMLCCHFP